MDTRKIVADYITAQNDHDAIASEYRAAFVTAWNSFGTTPYILYLSTQLTRAFYIRLWATNAYTASLPIPVKPAKKIKLTKGQSRLLRSIDTRERRGAICRATFHSMDTGDQKIARKLHAMKLIESRNVNGFVALSVTELGHSALVQE